jgi:4-hydroxyphenylpyruvate dioxygenase
MQQLGTDLMLVCSSVSPAALGGIDRAAQDFHELGNLAAAAGVKVGYEALAWGRHVFDHRDAWEVVRRADHQNIGVILDSFRNMPGEGDLPVLQFMRAVAATGYDGPLSLEIFNDQFRGGSPRAIAADGQRSLVYLMDQVARIEPDIAISVPAMPDRIEVTGIEFIEFAADAEAAQSLRRSLRPWGSSAPGGIAQRT